MKPNGTISLAIIGMLYLLFFSGVSRHDVKEEKYRELANKKQFDCVGQVFQSTDSTERGSCVLISDKYVLSATHVLIDGDTQTDSSQINDDQSIITYSRINDRVTDITKLYLVFKGQKVRIKRLILHPYYLDSLTKGSCDIAILELEKPLRAITPARLNTGFDELNSDVVGVGFGASGPANRPDLVGSFNKKIAGENVIDRIEGFLYHGVETKLMCDFDHPSRDDCNEMGDPKPRPLEYISSGGDSGGALFRKKGREWELLGICSGSGIDLDQFLKTFYYGQLMEWTRVSAFTKWIESETSLNYNGK